MIDIPTNDVKPSMDDFEKKVDEACNELVNGIKRQRRFRNSVIHAQINTEHCYGGGFKMDVINEVAKRFVEGGWFVYLIRGGMYNNWTWLSVYSEPHQEGYTKENIPCYYERVK